METILFEPPKSIRSALLPFQQEVLIVPVGDVQYGAQGCDFDRFARHIQWAAAKPNAYFLGMGDFVDFASPSNRGRLKASLQLGDLYETVEDALDDIALGHVDDVMRVLAPTRGRWIGWLEGHHFWEFKDGITSDQLFARKLDAPFLGTSALLEIRFRRPDREHSKRSDAAFRIWCHHGHSTGSARTQAAPLNALEHIVKAFDADVYLVGHYHRKVAAKLPRIAARFPKGGGKGRLVHKNMVVACTGSFLRGYDAGYVEKRMLAPTALGGVAIWARPRWDHEGYAEVDIDVSL